MFASAPGPELVSRIPCANSENLIVRCERVRQLWSFQSDPFFPCISRLLGDTGPILNRETRTALPASANQRNASLRAVASGRVARRSMRTRSVPAEKNQSSPMQPARNNIHFAKVAVCIHRLNGDSSTLVRGEVSGLNETRNLY